ncbi:MAG: hypothetical protein AB7T32_09500 [Dehalococcoidia bacterium]
MQEHGIDEAQVDMRVLKQLDHLEKLLWVGKPPGAMTLRPSDAMIPLGAVVFVAFITIADIPYPFFFWLLPIGLVGSFALAKLERSNTVYALTDQKVMLFGRVLGRSEIILKLAELPEFRLDERSDGSGTVLFGGYYYSWQGQSLISDLTPSTDKTPPRVELGPGAREVFALFEKALEDARFRART